MVVTFGGCVRCSIVSVTKEHASFLMHQFNFRDSLDSDAQADNNTSYTIGELLCWYPPTSCAAIAYGFCACSITE